MFVDRVAVVAYHSSPLHEPGSGDGGGMTVYVRGLARAFAQRGVHTDIFTRASHPDDRITFLSDRVRVVPIEAGPRALVPKEDLPNYLDDFIASVRAFTTMQRMSYDIVHSHYWQSGLAAKSLAEGWGIPLVHSHHTLGRVKNARLAPGDAPEPATRLDGEQEVIAAADVLIASTEEEYHALACLYRAPHDRLKILPPGVDHALFRPGDRGEARARLGLPSDRPLLLFAGRIQPLKGCSLAIRALAELNIRFPEAELLVVGGPSGGQGDAELEKLHALVDELGLQRRVHFVGPKPHKELPFYYQAVDAVLVCSHSESFALTPLEAQASGRPVVGTPVGGLSHLVREGRSGFLIRERDPEELAERLARILDDEDLARSFEQQAHRDSLPFSWEAAADSFLDLYDCLIGDRFPELCTC